MVKLIIFFSKIKILEWKNVLTEKKLKINARTPSLSLSVFPNGG